MTQLDGSPERSARPGSVRSDPAVADWNVGTGVPAAPDGIAKRTSRRRTFAVVSAIIAVVAIAVGVTISSNRGSNSPSIGS